MKNKMIITLVIVSIALLLGTVAYCEYDATYDTAVSELVTMSGLTSETVGRLYTAIGDWDNIQENIFVYKRLLELTSGDTVAYNKLFTLLKGNSPKDLLSIYQYMKDNNIKLEKIDIILLKYKEKGDLGTVLLDSRTELKEYKNYFPADEKAVRSWLDKGYFPDDILNADSLAMSKDMKIENVLALKTDKNTWDEIKEKLNPTVKKKDKFLTIAIKRGNITEKYSGENLKDVVKDVNEKTKSLETTDLTQKNSEYQKLQTKGFNRHEIDNIMKLSKETGVKVEEISTYKQTDKEWREVIEKYDN